MMDRHPMEESLQKKAEQREEGFTLIELLIVMSVMLILMTLAVPQMLKLTKTAHETSAMQSVRTIVQAQLQYNSQFPANGFACSLGQLGGDPKSGAPSAQAAQLIPVELAAGSKAGYAFAITNCNKVTVNNQDMITSFQVTAVPLSVGKSGDRGFCSDENNHLTYDPAGGTNCTQPVQ